MTLDLPALLDRVYYRYPSFLIDTVAEHEPGSRLVAVKNVTVNEEFFQGHFPGSPLMPGVLMIEALTQVAAVLILDRADAPPTARVWLRGVDNAKFRRQVVPGDRLRLEVQLGRIRSRLAKARGDGVRRRSAGRRGGSAARGRAWRGVRRSDGERAPGGARRRRDDDRSALHDRPRGRDRRSAAASARRS